MASSPTQGPTLVQAVYSFKGKNNDELCFKKGDVITVTQKEDGGWWEGTLAGTTGWFPSNYVKERKSQGVVLYNTKPSPVKLPVDLAAQQKVYRNLVLKDLIDSEKANVAELQTLITNFLHPLEKSEILNRDEYRQLVGNIDAIYETHSKLLIALEACNELPPLEQRIGKLFLSSAPQIKQIHLSYCSSHPRAICILNKHKDALNIFMESQGAASPGLLVLTTGLSKPFRRLEKYSGILQELKRHMEENHPDRGDTQRSVSVYKDIWSACSTKRKQKEQELEILTGGVIGWEGEELSSLGEIIHMGSVAVGPEHQDRYLVLFPSTLLMLSVSSRMSGFIYEGKLPLSGINVNLLIDSEYYKNAFEITGSLIDRIIAVCQTKEDQQLWVDSLSQAIRAIRKSSVSSPQPNPPPHKSPTKVSSIGLTNSGSWNESCLKPLPPVRYSLSPNKKNKMNLTAKKSIDGNFEEDIQILRVIEAYCSNTRTRSAIGSGQAANFALISKAQTSVPGVVIKERYVMDSIDFLRSQLSDLSTRVNSLTSKLDEEIQTRTALQNSVELKLAKVVTEGDEPGQINAHFQTQDISDSFLRHCGCRAINKRILHAWMVEHLMSKQFVRVGYDVEKGLKITSVNVSAVMNNKVYIIGAGYACDLRSHIDEEIDGHPLWISRFIKTNPEALRKTYMDYMNAGIDMINTLTYQANVPAYMKHFGLSESESYDLLKESVRLVRRVIDEFMKANPNRERPLIVGGAGSFGASLHDGSEYTGSFVDKYKMEDVMEWHRPRMSALIEEGVDIIAFETIPAMAEARVLLKLLKEFPRQKAWVSFQCKNSQQTAYGDDFKECVKECWKLNGDQLLAVGCNCLSPDFVVPLFTGINEPGNVKYPLVVYPNSGEAYSAEKGWHGNVKWDHFEERVFQWLDLGVRYLGSCCRTDVTYIPRNKAAARKWLQQKINVK